jgi:hypothetical protein
MASSRMQGTHVHGCRCRPSYRSPLQRLLTWTVRASCQRHGSILRPWRTGGWRETRHHPPAGEGLPLAEKKNNGERKGKQWHGHGRGAGSGSHFATVTWVSCGSGALAWTSCGSHDDLDKWRRIHCGAPTAAPLASTNKRSTKRDSSRPSSLWGFQTSAWAKLRKN